MSQSLSSSSSWLLKPLRRLWRDLLRHSRHLGRLADDKLPSTLELVCFFNVVLLLRHEKKRGGGIQLKLYVSAGKMYPLYLEILEFVFLPNSFSKKKNVST